MDAHDDDLLRFEAEGAEALPIADDEGYVEHAGARVWYSAYTHSAFGIHPTTFCRVCAPQRGSVLRRVGDGGSRCAVSHAAE
jgi:hypothetical protein